MKRNPKRINLDRPASLPALNRILVSTGLGLEVVRGPGYYYVTSSRDDVYRAIYDRDGASGFVDMGPRLTSYTLRAWVEAIARKLDSLDGRPFRARVLALLD